MQGLQARMSGGSESELLAAITREADGLSEAVAAAPLRAVQLRKPRRGFDCQVDLPSAPLVQFGGYLARGTQPGVKRLREIGPTRAWTPGPPHEGGRYGKFRP